MTGSSTNRHVDSLNNSGYDKIKIISNSGVLEVALPIGILLLVIIIVAIGCAICKQRKRPEKKQEVMNADENPGYGVYHLSETYERQYSTNEAVDNNDYYAQ